MPIVWGNEPTRNCLYSFLTVKREIKGALREVFIREWDRCHPSTPWDDTSSSGSRLHTMERLRPRASPYLSSYSNGDTKTWDCSALIDAILYSKAIGKSRLSLQVATAVDDLRNVRNEIMHAESDEISDDDFIALVNRIKNDFSILGVSTKSIDEVIEEKSMNTSFFKVPPSSAENHEEELDIFPIIKHMDTTVPWITRTITTWVLDLDLSTFGNEWFKSEQKKSIQKHFVMTLSGKDEESLLKSYKDFSNQVNCDDDVISKIMTSGLTNEEKILELKSQVQSKVKNWNSWLIMVTDVEDLEKTMRFLPQRGEEWENGLILISTSEGCSGYRTPRRGEIMQA